MSESSGLRLRFLGSGDAFGTSSRLQACLCLEGPDGRRVLIDCGATSLVALERAGIDPASIGWVLVSHLHGDHFGGLPDRMRRIVESAAWAGSIDAPAITRRSRSTGPPPARCIARGTCPSG